MSGRFSREREFDRNDRGPLSGHTNSNDPRSLMSRVFIGNLPHDKITRDELLEMFSKYGRVTAVNILKGFGFIQYEKEDDARRAVAMENSAILKGQTLDIKMAAEGKKKKPAQGYQNRDDDRGFRDRSPVRDRGPSFGRGRPRDPYVDPMRGRPLPNDMYDSLRRDPYIDPLVLAARRDPYALARDPYAAASVRDPYGLPPAVKPTLERPPVDCEITVLDQAQREYANGIERRFKTHGMLTFVNVLPSEDLLSKAQEDISKRGIPFNIVVSPLNQQHRSITARILHGTPQEHRNMPLEDALKLVTSNFEVYLRNLRAGVSSAAATPVAEKPVATGNEEFTLPDSQTSYLFNLLADNKFLTLDELNTVIRYLNQRRDQLEKQGATAKPDSEAIPEEAALAQQQQELQAKILSVLGGSSGSNSSTANTASLSAPGYSNPDGSANVDYSNLAINSGSQLAAGMNGNSGNTSAGAYDLNTPGVQQALDNLISSGPELLQNLSGVAQSSHQVVQGNDALRYSQAYSDYPNY